MEPLLPYDTEPTIANIANDMTPTQQLLLYNPDAYGTWPTELHHAGTANPKPHGSQYIQNQKICTSTLCVCSTNLGFRGGSANRYCCMYVLCTTYVPGISRLLRYVYDTRYVLRTRYVCTWYQPADERSARGRTSDDSYMYQLSLVVATATAVSLIYICTRIAHHFFFPPCHLYLRPSILSLLVATQIRGHIAGSSPPLPTTVRALHFLSREDFSSFLPRQLAYVAQ